MLVCRRNVLRTPAHFAHARLQDQQVSADLIKVEGAFDVCENGIRMIEHQVVLVEEKLSGAELSVYDVVYWREEKEQLCKKEEQLRTEQEQLRKERQLLRERQTLC